MPEQHFRLRIISESHPGRKRPNNEDHFVVDESRGIIVQADGMGGHRSVEVASEMATRLLMAKLRLLGNNESTEKKNTTSCSKASGSQSAKPTIAFIKQRQKTPSIKEWEPRLSRFC
ncbi:MAG: protein phosphatase 2C domain-containing protein [Pseudomonadota bacterium]|nr:protein phosphatase 2C domain-containing protein [Pseudomonadota bacterium]